MNSLQSFKILIYSLQIFKNYEIFFVKYFSSNENYSAKGHSSTGVLIAYKIFVASCSLSDRYQSHKLLNTLIFTQMGFYTHFYYPCVHLRPDGPASSTKIFQGLFRVLFIIIWTEKDTHIKLFALAFYGIKLFPEEFLFWMALTRDLKFSRCNSDHSIERRGIAKKGHLWNKSYAHSWVITNVLSQTMFVNCSSMTLQCLGQSVLKTMVVYRSLNFNLSLAFRTECFKDYKLK